LIIINHQMFQFIIQDFFKGSPSKTFVDLEHFLKDNLPGKDPQYYQYGGKFIMSMLESAGSIRIENQHIYFENANEERNEADKEDNIVDSDTNDITEESLPALQSNQSFSKPNINSVTIKDEYYIMIKTPHFNFDGRIEGPIQIKLIEGIIQTIKAELNIND